MYLDYEDLFERFSILTIDGCMSDEKAFDFLKNKTTSVLYKELVGKVRELTIG